MGRKRRAGWVLGVVSLVGVGGLFVALASGAIECTQLFEPERYPTFEDIVANGLGALAGAVLCTLAARRRK